ncbi:hypothetical protein [Sandaracinus amylolyticus]|uniref:Uncharacterized protein n=1 Tax=Sandaracinus amylolyticus TaxID=927083 RepID=A0A0F6YG92_9BACT|nr:hypothetical protein [Sandaracinus amylolyticus]AKF03622.1 hypothetical protein DB32_000771 [Sandaracinus amylolyticus]
MTTSATSELRTGVSLVQTHPGISVALGAAIVLSLCATCTGLGAIVGPWFVCELYGVQIAAATGIARPRTSAWIRAAAIVLATVVIVALTGWLAALGFGPDVATADAAEEPLPWPEALRRVGLITGSVILAVGFIAPFLYAPLVLIDRGGRIGGAVVESAWLASRGGALRHLALTFVVFFLQLSPALIAAMIVARTFERAATPLGLLGALPLMTITIPLGQAWTTAAYLERRALLAAPRAVQVRGPVPRSLVALLALDVLAPVLALAMLGLTALRPSTPAESDAPPGTTLIERDVQDERARIVVPDTTITVVVEGRELIVRAGDGDADGAGRLPRAWPSAIEQVRVVRARDVYAIVIEAGDRVFHTRVDGAGMRVDDSIRRRLEQHVPTWALLTILAAFLVFGLLGGRALASLGALRAEVDAPERAAAYARSMRWGLTIAPFVIAALLAGLVSITR